MSTRKVSRIATFTALALAVAALEPRPAAAQPETAGWLARETARDYRERARYPESSRALRAGDPDPVRARRAPTRQSLPGPDGATPALAVWAGQVSFTFPAPVDLFAELEGPGRPRATAVTAEVRDAAGSLVALLAYRDDGQGPDRKANDGVWSARLELPAALEPELAASYLVAARATLPDGGVREAVGGYLVSNPWARLTGRFRDEARGGDVVVAAEVEVRRAGRCHLAGTLATLAGEPVGTAQAAAELPPGRHWIELSFYGLMFHDRQVAGPYRLATAALATAAGMPNALSDLQADVHVTRPYRLDQLTRAPFGESKLLDAAARLEAQARSSEQPRP